jgi:OOP family OmpA-OmpF porin
MIKRWDKIMKKNYIAAFVLAALGFSGSAMAQSYLGGSAGQSKWNLDCRGGDSCSNAAAGVKIFGGYDYSPNISFEGAYFYLNQVGIDYPGIKAEINGRGMDFAVLVKTQPYRDFTGFAKLGASFAKGEIELLAGPYKASDRNYSTQPLFGLGVMYQIDSKISLRAEYERRKLRMSTIPDLSATTNMLSIGIQSQF